MLFGEDTLPSGWLGRETVAVAGVLVKIEEPAVESGRLLLELVVDSV